MPECPNCKIEAQQIKMVFYRHNKQFILEPEVFLSGYRCPNCYKQFSLPQANIEGEENG